MIDYETIARSNHRSGMNCAMSVYDALGMNNQNKTTPPRPRDNGGMCGAVLAAEQTIREMGGTDEDVIIIAVLVALALLFRTGLMEYGQKVMDFCFDDSKISSAF